jgi:hypothetical protein
MITEKAMLAAVHIRVWTAVKHDRKVSREVADQHGVHQGAGRYNKQLLSRDLKKVEGQQFTLRVQKNSQDSVRVTDEAALPKCYCRIEARIPGVIWETVLSLLPAELAKTLESSVQEIRPDNDAIRTAVTQSEVVPGAEMRRGLHLRVV